MQFEENALIKNFGKYFGFSLAIFIFLSVFYTILRFLNKMPASVKYWHVIVLIIVIIATRLIWSRIKYEKSQTAV